MKRIGIIGAENSHTAQIARVVNIKKQIPGFTVEYVWGETDEFAAKAAEQGQIPGIVKTPKQMLGKIEALIVDHRHPKLHLPAAKPFLSAGLPMFIDKPFCYRVAEGKAFLKEARKRKVPVTSFSVLVHQRSFHRFQKKVLALGEIVAADFYGPSDLKSQWGGVFFYGIHQVDMALKAFGYDVRAVEVVRNTNGSTAALLYPSGLTVTLHLIKKGCKGFHASALGEKGALHQQIKMDKSPYITGIRAFTAMFRTGAEPESHAHMLGPVAVLEAMEKSVRTGKAERVQKV